MEREGKREAWKCPDCGMWMNGCTAMEIDEIVQEGVDDWNTTIKDWKRKADALDIIMDRSHLDHRIDTTMLSIELPNKTSWWRSDKEQFLKAIKALDKEGE